MRLADVKGETGAINPRTGRTTRAAIVSGAGATRSSLFHPVGRTRSSSLETASLVGSIGGGERALLPPESDGAPRREGASRRRRAKNARCTGVWARLFRAVKFPSPEVESFALIPTLLNSSCRNCYVSQLSRFPVMILELCRVYAYQSFRWSHGRTGQLRRVFPA